MTANSPNIPSAPDNAIPVPGGLRDAVQKLGLLTFVRNARGMVRGDVRRWLGDGCPSPAPNIVKMGVVRAFVRKFRTPVFIETGTFLGSMIEHIAADRVECHSIEIDETLFDRAKQILRRHSNITLHLGDSATILPHLLARLDRPATFWLDGHYSGGFTSRSDVDTPVSAELEHILAHPIRNHVILIDDARDFTGEDGYPRLSTLLAHFETHPDYRAEVSADIIRITPR